MSKLKIDVLTLFPGMFDSPLGESLLQKAQAKGLLKIRVIDLRKFSKDKHRKVDDKIFGGGSGMLLQVEPIWRALKKLGALGPASLRPTVVYLSPQGERLTQKIVKDLAAEKRLVFLCGRYEGIDERVMSWVDREISIGDYVLTGGEIPAMVLMDSLARMVPGVVKERESVENDSFYDGRGRLDCSHYSRPAEFLGLKVPEVLLSGNHKAIEAWRKKDALEKTERKRPDLL
jgi:tRNA (guanine37-N1)-methyltransferase